MQKCKRIRKQLNAAISAIDERHSDYCINPEKDHTRNRKLSFETVVRIVLSMTNHSLQAEINRYWNFSDQSPTKSAFIQQRQKISPEAFRAVFDEFTKKIAPVENFRGYRLLACDGTSVNLPRNPADTSTSVHAKPTAESYNMLHINAMYDLMNGIYTDYTIDLGMNIAESAALVQMASKLKHPEKTILTADRGYGYLSTICKLTELRLNFVLRAKDILSNNFLASLGLPNEEFDLDFSKILTFHRYKKYLSNPQYIVVNKRNSLDFSEKDEIPVSFRVCRFKLPSGGFECLVTNLPRSKFSVPDLKYIYHLRWGIETSFRELKYSIGLMFFHAKKLDSVLQEVHAAMLMLNFCSLIIQSVPLHQKDSWKHQHIINFAAAVGCCRSFFSSGETQTLNLILRDQSLIRPDRQYGRYLHDTKPAKSLTYRVS